MMYLEGGGKLGLWHHSRLLCGGALGLKPQMRLRTRDGIFCEGGPAHSQGVGFLRKRRLREEREEKEDVEEKEVPWTRKNGGTE